MDDKDTSVKIDTSTRDRFKALAKGRGLTMRDYLAELAEREEHERFLDSATAAFKRAVERPGIAENFDRDFGGLPTADHTTGQAA
ncbi:antitoxin MazE7 [Streptomyces sp. NBC_01465]|uniref:antitoxin MazE7 n=1 Tax=Streptomyces sp. NBC_01465 TaxID=2903878 RepID=UPI002E373797|nr:antitoxin MazE7 [Streptomyces sp. NBC_01465]